MERSKDYLLLREVVDGDEIVVRALHEPFWDAENKRGTPSAFGNGNLISVSRTSVLSESQIIQILKQDLETPDRRIEAIAEVSVERIDPKQSAFAAGWMNRMAEFVEGSV